MPGVRRVVHLRRAGASGARRDALAPDAVLSFSGSGLGRTLQARRSRLRRRSARPVVIGTARPAQPAQDEAGARGRFAHRRFRRGRGRCLRASGTCRFGFRFVGQVTIDETPTAAAAGCEVFRLRVGFDDELRALAAWTSQEQWFHGAFSGGSCASHARTAPFSARTRRLRNLPQAAEGFPDRAWPSVCKSLRAAFALGVHRPRPLSGKAGADVRHRCRV